MNKIPIKYLKFAQRAGGAGWNKHVSPWLRRKTNKRLRRIFKHGLEDT